MKIRSVLAVGLTFVGSLAFAQVCPSTPGSVCLVPSQSTTRLQANTYVAPSTAMTTTTTVPYTAGTCMPGMASTSYVCPVGTMGYAIPTTSMVSTGQVCNYASADANCISGQISALRGDVRSLQGSVVAASLEMRGQQLLTQVNSLMADEMMFRQQIAANPNLPNAQAIANSLTMRANNLNRDLAAFNRELAMIPADQRPYLAQSLNAFTVAYWNPTMQQFSAYSTQFPQSTTTYQPAFAANPWLQSWQSGYQTSLNNLGTVPQTYASTSWWSTTQVLGSTECYPMGMTSMGQVSQGTWVYIPAGAIMSTGMTCPAPVMTPPVITPMPSTGVLGTTETFPPTTTPPAVTTPPVTTTPPAATTTPAPGTGMTGQGY